MLQHEGWAVSASTVGQLHEPAVVRAAQARRQRRSRRRRYAQRNPWDDVPRAPGDLVQIDTTPIEVRPALLPPRSPKLNGHVARAHRTHQEEFYDLIELPDALAEHNALLQEWERTYNTVRPHQALSYRTPQEVVTQWQTQRPHP